MYPKETEVLKWLLRLKILKQIKRSYTLTTHKRANTESDAVRNICAQGGEKSCGCVRVGIRRLLEQELNQQIHHSFCQHYRSLNLLYIIFSCKCCWIISGKNNSVLFLFSTKVCPISSIKQALLNFNFTSFN